MPAENAGDAASTVTPPAPSSEGDIPQQSAPRADPRNLLSASDVPSEVIESVFGKPVAEAADSAETAAAPPEKREVDLPIEPPPVQPSKPEEPEVEPAAPSEKPPDEQETPSTSPDSEEEEDTPHVSGEYIKKAHFDKRVGKLTRQKSQLKERVEELETELSTTKSELEKTQKITLTPTPADPLADVDDVRTLNERVNQAKAMRAWCRRNSDGITLEDGREVTRDMVANWLDTYDNVIESAPTREKYLTEKSEWDNFARQAYPHVFDTKTPEYQASREMLRLVPELARRADVNVLLGRYILGYTVELNEIEKLRKKEQQPNGQQALPPELRQKPPPIAPATPKPPSRSVTPSRQNVEDATKHVIEEGGDDRSLIDLVAAHRKARQNTQTGQSAPLT
jgi:hypothetical protein